MPDLPDLHSIQEKTLPAIERPYEHNSVSELVKIINQDALDIKKQTLYIISVMDHATSALNDNITSNQYDNIIDNYIDALFRIVNKNTDILRANSRNLDKQKRELDKIKGKTKNPIVFALSSFISQLDTSKNLLEDINDKINFIIKDRKKTSGSGPEYQQLQAYKSAIKKVINIDVQPKSFGDKFDDTFVFEIPYSAIKDYSVKNRIKISDEIHDIVFSENNSNFTSSIAIHWIKETNDIS